MLVTTGGSHRNIILNIHDLAGNIREITLESNDSGSISLRGGTYKSDSRGSTDTAVGRAGAQYYSSDEFTGFRSALY